MSKELDDLLKLSKIGRIKKELDYYFNGRKICTGDIKLNGIRIDEKHGLIALHDLNITEYICFLLSDFKECLKKEGYEIKKGKEAK